MFENVDGRTDGRTDDGRTTDAGVTGILIAHLGAFGSGELKRSPYICKYSNYLRQPLQEKFQYKVVYFLLSLR